VELDPRFENNVNRVKNQIVQEELVRPSREVVVARDVSPRDLPARMASATDDLGNGRVWGGAPISAENDVFKEAVAIVGNGKICSGTMVAADKVLTAGHCYCRGVSNEVLVGTSVLSPIERVKVDPARSEAYRSCDILDKDLSVGDMALLQLERPISNPPPIPKNASLAVVRDSAAIRAVGFGRTEASIGFKYQVNVVIASHQCDGTAAMVGLPDEQVYRCKSSYELVAAGLNRDTCGGDSGGGVYIFGPDNQPYLIGVTSRAVDPRGKCGLGGIYPLLSAPPLREWLESKGLRFAQ